MDSDDYSPFQQHVENSFNWKVPPSISMAVRRNCSGTRFNDYEETSSYFGVAPHVQTAQAPNRSAVMRWNNSATRLHVDDGYGQATSISAMATRNSSLSGLPNTQSPNLHGVVVKKYSATRLNGYEQAPPPSFSGVFPRNLSATDVSTAIPAFINPQENVAGRNDKDITHIPFSSNLDNYARQRPADAYKTKRNLRPRGMPRGGFKNSTFVSRRHQLKPSLNHR
ncbi:hypothetical protein R6Q59_028481 [Mikania micrantha]